MKPRDRQLATIRHEIPDRIPIDAIHVENTDVLAPYLGCSPDAILECLELDGRLVGLGYLGEPPEPRNEEELNEWGTAAGDDYGTTHRYPLASVSTVAEAERYAWPNPAAYGYANARESARVACGRYAVRGPYWEPLFCRVASLMGLEQAMVRMLDTPAVFEAVLERVFRITLDLCERFTRALGDSLDIFYLGDDFAHQHALMFDPELWRRWFKPRFARLFQVGKDAGKVVWFHSCGNTTAVLPDLIDIGMDVWETVQLHTLPMSPEELKREYGRHITFFGGINTQSLPFSTPEAVRAEVRNRIEALGEGGGYICGPDHHVKPDVSAENTVALFEAAKSFRAEGYTREASGRSTG